MEIVLDIKKVKKGCVLTVGNFDGVHIGHQETLSAAKQIAAKKATKLIAMTFEPHPLAVLHPRKNLCVLTPPELKKHLLAEFGVDYLFVLKSSLKLLKLSPQDFVEQFLVKNIQPSVVVEGENFNFGSGRTGSVRTLQKLGAEKDFQVSVVGAKEVKLSTGRVVKISSTVIRNTLTSGRVADAAVALGRPYRLIGQAVPGLGKGKQLGFPTANIKPSQQVTPAQGVYAGFVEIGDSEADVCTVKKKIPAALSIGRAETFGSDNPLMIEAHILTGSVEDLSGKWLAMDFIKCLRGQIRFENEIQLAEQIAKDCEKAKDILATEATENK